MPLNPENSSLDACWNRIGIWGRQSRRCPKLEDLIHCHNCEVYTEAGRHLLDRPLPPDYQEQWRQHYARTLPREDTRGRIAVLVFRIASEWLALPVASVEEVIDPVAVHRLPHRSGGLLQGIVNVHGRLHLCVSLAELLGIERPAPAIREKRRFYPRMLTIRRQESRFAFHADEVQGAHRYATSELLAVPSTLSQAMTKSSAGILSLDNRRVGILDEDFLFHALESKLE